MKYTAALLPAVMWAGIALSGCGSSDSAEPPSASPIAGPDLSRIAEVEGDIPASDFIPQIYPTERLTEQFAENVGAFATYGKPFSVTPAQCRSLFKPVTVTPGAEHSAIRADAVRGKGMISVGAYAPATLPVDLSIAGCDQMGYAVDDEYGYRGTVARIPAPPINGATTFAFRNQVDGFPEINYLHGAFVGRDLLVKVEARLEPGSSPEPLLADLLVAAVTAIRGN